MNTKLFKKYKKSMVEALKKNSRKAKEKMRNECGSGGGRCCLCVIQDTVDGVQKSREYTESDGSELHYNSIAYSIFKSKNPNLKYPALDGNRIMLIETSASDINDGDSMPELSHKKIAELIQNHDILETNRKFTFYVNSETEKVVYLKTPMTLKQMQAHVNSKAK